MTTNNKSMHSCMVCLTTKQEKRSGVREQFKSQFGKPRGFWGKVAGWIMAHRPSNRQRNAWAVSLLDIQPADHVLEIGFGPGLAIQQMSQRVTRGRVVGIDHSDVMLLQAAKRNASAIARGTVQLRLGSVADIPSLPGPFDKCLAVNVIQFWDSPTEALTALYRTLNPGGTIAIIFQPRFHGATDEDTRSAAHQIRDFLHSAGFSQIRIEIKPMKPVAVAGVLGTHDLLNHTQASHI